ncbi:MAG TPA: di-heme oxidoredictase family protein [Bauldia sp.]|nr:di-heme oxidoredictase family protein [Bauldia sp.]
MKVAVAPILLTVLLVGGAVGVEAPAKLLGGETTVSDEGSEAFLHLVPNAPEERRKDFSFGSRLFAIEWVPFPNTVKIFDGLGPTFNRDACAACHKANGRGRPPDLPGDPMDSMLVRLSAVAVDGKTEPHPLYGDQLNDRAIDGVVPEGRAILEYDEIAGRYGDGTPYTLLRPRLRFVDTAFGTLDDALASPRVAPAVIGLGLLEAVPEATLVDLTDPDDADGDGISGRINRLDADGTVGRFGWKANVADLRRQSAAAAIGDMGLTTSLFPDQNCPPVQTGCRASDHEPSPEISDPFLGRIVTYMRTIAVPAQRSFDDPDVVAGYAAFRRFGCDGCHVPTLATDDTAPLPELRDQVFHPYTDLLLHDLGEALADRRPDHDASGSEWRTPPLWGLGLVPVVNGHDRLLHDGRARGFAEAILWHGGEAEAAREAFRTANRREREALIAFLRSL